MRTLRHLIIIVALLALAAGCAKNRAPQHQPQPGDTLYTAEAAMRLYAYEPKRALTFIDSALIVGNIDEDVAKLLRAKVYSQSLVERCMDTAQQMLLELLESDYTKDLHNREVVLDLLGAIARNKYQIERQLHWATLKAECCREQGRETEALRTEAEMGYLFANLGEEEKGLAKLNGVIATLDGQRHTDEMDACIIAIKRKITVLSMFGRYEEIIPLAQRIIAITDDYREHYTEYTDNAYRLPHEEQQTEQYCNFYTAQAQVFLARSYAQLGDKDNARHYLSLLEQSDYGTTLGSRKMVAPVWRQLGEYDKMLATYHEMEEQMGSDTLNSDFAEILHGYAQAAQAQGDFAASAAYWQRYAQLNILLNKELLESRAYEYATRYQLQEERINTEREQAKAQNNRNLAIAGFILVLIAAGFIVWLLIQQRAINRKNRVLVEQISEAVKYKKKNEELNEKNEQTGEVGKERGLDSADRQLFVTLSETIRRERLFTDPNFGRQTLVDRFHLTERRIGAAFAHAGSLPDFIRELRVEYACQMLTEHPDMSIGDIAAAAGFSSLSVFSREFKRKLEVTPTYYRDQMVPKIDKKS